MGCQGECIICGGYKNRGIKILDKFICDECEETLINTDICDGMYDRYKELIKKGVYGCRAKQPVK